MDMRLRDIHTYIPNIILICYSSRDTATEAEAGMVCFALYVRARRDDKNEDDLDFGHQSKRMYVLLCAQE